MNLPALLKEELKNLPGEDYQFKMAPEGRRTRGVGVKKIRKAAVAIILYESDKGYEFILTKRPVYDGAHSGQVSFPGGKMELFDQDIEETSIRETMEEIGIELKRESILGKLTPLLIPVSGFRVVPFVFYINKPTGFRLEEEEVAYLIHCPLRLLLEPATKNETVIYYKDLSIKTPYYAIQEEVVWGATAMMLSEFEEILKRIQTKNPEKLLFRDS